MNTVDPSGHGELIENALLRVRFFAIRVIQFAARSPRCTFELIRDILFAFTYTYHEEFVLEIAIPTFVSCLQGPVY